MNIQEKRRVVLFAEEAGFAVVPAVHDVEGYTVKMDAGGQMDARAAGMPHHRK